MFGPQVDDVQLVGVLSHRYRVVTGVPEQHAGQEHTQQWWQVKNFGDFAQYP